MKKVIFLNFIIVLMFTFTFSQIQVIYPTTTPSGPVFDAEKAIIPCSPLTFKFNISNLASAMGGSNSFILKIKLTLRGKDANGQEVTDFPLLGSELANYNHLLPLAVCSVLPLSVGQNDVNITNWETFGDEIDIQFDNVSSWSGSGDATVSIFFGGGTYPYNSGGYIYTNFPSGVYQDGTFLILFNFMESGVFSTDYPVFLDAHFSIAGSGNVTVSPDDVTLYKFTSDTSWDMDYANVLPVARSFSKIVTTNLGTPSSNTKFLFSSFGLSDKDFVTINSLYNLLCVLFGEDEYAGSFSSMELPYKPVSISAGDVDGDGKNEIIVGGDDGSVNFYEMGDLSLSKYGLAFLNKKFEIMVTGEATDSTLADVNNDGKYDYVYIDSNSSVASVLFGGDFSDSISYNLDGIPKKVTYGDFNGDGLKDVCIAKVTGNNVSVLYNNGDGTFDLEEETLGSFSIPLDNVDRGDFDRDGVDDVALTSSFNDCIVIAKGSVNGLGYKNTIGINYSPSAISVENFDGKNGDDVLVGFSDFKELLLCTSDMNGDVSPSYSINTIEDVAVDPDNNTVLPEDVIVNVVMGVTYGGVNDRSGIVGIVKNNFNAVFFPDYTNISFSLINPVYDSKLTANFELYDRVGNILNYRTLSIDEGSQFARYFTSDELFGDGWGDAYVRTFITSPEVYGMYLFNTPSNPQYMDGGKNLSAYDVKDELYLPIVNIDGDQKTTVYVINPFKTEEKVILYLYGSDGTLKSQKEYLFGGRGSKKFDLKTLFPDCVETDYLKIFSDNGVIGLESYGDYSTNLACVEGLSQNWDISDIYCPHVAWGQFGSVNYYSKLSLINISDKSSDLNFKLYDDNGQLMKEVDGKHIGPHEKLLLNLKEFFGIDSSTSGYLEISLPSMVNGFKLVGAITFGDADNGKFMATLPLSAEPGNFVTGHIANGEIGGVNYFTGIAILSPYEDTDVNIECYNQNGLKVKEKTIHIDKGARYVRMIGDIFPDLGDMFGGYVKISANNDGELYVFQLFGDNDLNFLSAVPAVIIRE